MEIIEDPLDKEPFKRFILLGAYLLEASFARNQSVIIRKCTLVNYLRVLEAVV